MLASPSAVAKDRRKSCHVQPVECPACRRLSDCFDGSERVQHAARDSAPGTPGPCRLSPAWRVAQHVQGQRDAGAAGAGRGSSSCGWAGAIRRRRGRDATIRAAQPRRAGMGPRSGTGRSRATPARAARQPPARGVQVRPASDSASEPGAPWGGGAGDQCARVGLDVPGVLAPVQEAGQGAEPLARGRGPPSRSTVCARRSGQVGCRHVFCRHLVQAPTGLRQFLGDIRADGSASAAHLGPPRQGLRVVIDQAAKRVAALSALLPPRATFFSAAGSAPEAACPLIRFASARASSGECVAGLPMVTVLFGQRRPVSGSVPRGR